MICLFLYHHLAVNHSTRINRIQELLSALGTDALLVGPGTNMKYLAGIEAMLSERLYLLVIPVTGPPSLILPKLEIEGAQSQNPNIQFVSWSDEQGYESALVQCLASLGKRISVDDDLPARFLLDAQRLGEDHVWKRGTAVAELRIIKTKEERQLLKAAAAVADKALEKLRDEKFSGSTEHQIGEQLTELLLEFGHSVVTFMIVGSGPNGALPHHHAGDRVIEQGDVIVLDFGGTHKGYQSDMTRSLVVGGAEPDPDYVKVHTIVLEAHDAAMSAAKPGVTCEAVDAAARSVVEAAGYGEYFTHRTGHGIGVDIHEPPFIVGGNKSVLREGMAFSIEPGIYLPGRFGVRIEDIVIVTSEGCESVSHSERAPIVVK